MNNLKKLSIYLFAALALCSSCEKSNFYNNTGGGGMTSQQAVDVVTAIRDDTYGWSLASGYATRKKNGDLAIYFFKEGNNKMTIELTPFRGAQTYQLNGASKVTFIQDGVEYRDSYGWVKLTEVTEKAVIGRFEFSLQSTFNNINMKLTEGEFAVLIN
ncbi:MAG: hypothetical protein EOP56_09840 [Sphingobacteriales bacterium]|nr:MAG: hypothetical protein EOP56_09840 [Sphingobacteriales bacterium]